MTKSQYFDQIERVIFEFVIAENAIQNRRLKNVEMNLFDCLFCYRRL